MSADRTFRVLVVDGNEVGQAKIASDMMNYEPVRFIITHKQPNCVLECLYEVRWHAIVLDAPELQPENLDLIRAIKETRPMVPLICVTDDEDLDRAEQAVMSGCEDVFVRRAVNGVTVPREVVLSHARRMLVESGPNLVGLKRLFDNAEFELPPE